MYTYIYRGLVVFCVLKISFNMIARYCICDFYSLLVKAS